MTVWIRETGGAYGGFPYNCDTDPSPTIQAKGIGGHWHSQYHLEDDGKPMTITTIDKPPYRVPTMDEVRAIPWNGLTVASTFSGAGGSCTGYRMAGYRVVWANEFVPAAQDSYLANCSDRCTLDKRDIRTVQPEDILKATGLAVGELDLFDGSPPCQAFSTAGKRDKGWGEQKTYEHGATQANEQLFDDYIRLLRGLQPKTFVAENVSGLVKGKAKGFFLRILADLKASGYKVSCRVLDAQWLGVPQSRQRTIFVGVRNDIDAEPCHPSPLGYRYSVRDALPWIGSIEGANGFNAHAYQLSSSPAATIQAGRPLQCQPLPPSRKVGAYGVSEVNPQNPCPTVTCASPGNDLEVPHGTERRKFTIAELKRICSFPDDFILTGSYAQQWERLGNSVPPLMMRAIASTIRDEILSPAMAHA